MTTSGSPGPRGSPSSSASAGGGREWIFCFTPRLSGSVSGRGEARLCPGVASFPLAASARPPCAASSHLEEGVSSSAGGTLTLSLHSLLPHLTAQEERWPGGQAGALWVQV